ncbi:M20 family metallopeptidase [Alicyclobacillus curvatus]|nr:M20 family metallopeptidase [Alicyclobacillus curvatus]
MNPILEYLEQHQQEMLADLKTFVCTETPSTDKQRLDEFSAFLRQYAENLGGQVEVIPASENGNHLRIKWGMSENDGLGEQESMNNKGGLGDRQGMSEETPSKQLLIVGHFDTVWAAGTLGAMPFAVDADGRVSGPGVFDMKGGLVQGFWAIRALREVTGKVPPLVFICNSDEEIGSHSSRAVIEEEAKKSTAAFILESSMDGDLKTARKGVGIYHIEVEGKAAHAGLDPLAGISAIDELARQVLFLHEQTDLTVGTTVNVGIISGGTRSNVTAPYASAEVDVRIVSAAEAGRMDDLMMGLSAYHPGAMVKVSGGINRPPMERTEATGQLFAVAREAAAELGFDVDEVAVGGGSDGNFCAAVGTPVLDGLGPVGGGAHAVHEHLLASEMPKRAALLAELIQRLG